MFGGLPTGNEIGDGSSLLGNDRIQFLVNILFDEVCLGDACFRIRKFGLFAPLFVGSFIETTAMLSLPLLWYVFFAFHPGNYLTAIV